MLLLLLSKGTSQEDLKAKRDARRRRTEEHDSQQNRSTSLQNSKLEDTERKGARDRSRIKRDERRTEEGRTEVGKQRREKRPSDEQKPFKSGRVADENVHRQDRVKEDVDGGEGRSSRSQESEVTERSIGKVDEIVGVKSVETESEVRDKEKGVGVCQEIGENHESEAENEFKKVTETARIDAKVEGKIEEGGMKKVNEVKEVKDYEKVNQAIEVKGTELRMSADKVEEDTKDSLKHSEDKMNDGEECAEALRSDTEIYEIRRNNEEKENKEKQDELVSEEPLKELDHPTPNEGSVSVAVTENGVKKDSLSDSELHESLTDMRKTDEQVGLTEGDGVVRIESAEEKVSHDQVHSSQLNNEVGEHDKKKLKKNKELGERKEKVVRSHSDGQRKVDNNQLKVDDNQRKVGDDSWKKTTRKKKIVDKDREVELRVLKRTGKLTSKLDSCEQRDKESSEAWKKKVKTRVRKHRSLDEETEKELKELSRVNDLKDRIKSCDQRDIENNEMWKKEVKKNAVKQKSLDEDTEKELKELSTSSRLKDRVKFCEEKDFESSEAWTKEVKKDEERKKMAIEEASEELKEFSESSRLKSLITSCAKRDEKRDESWKEAKEKKKEKSLDEQDELEELSNLSKVKSKIIQCCEERDKESAEASKREVRSGKASLLSDETTQEELQELSKSVDVKKQVESRIQDEGKLDESQKGFAPEDEEELKSVDLKSRLEIYKEESRKGRTRGKQKDKEDMGEKTPSVEMDVNGDCTSVDAELLSDDDKITTKSSVANKEKADSVAKGPEKASTRQDVKGQGSVGKDRKEERHTSPSKRDGKIARDGAGGGGRTSPTKRETKGIISPTKDNLQSRSKLESIRSNLYEGSKNTPKGKRESLERVSKTVSIKDRIAACKERDKISPRKLTEVTSPKRKDTAAKVPEKSSPATGLKEVEKESGVANVGEANDRTPVNHMGNQFTSVEEEIKGASIKDALSFWHQPGEERQTSNGNDIGTLESARNGTEHTDEAVDVNIKGKVSYWEKPGKEDERSEGESPGKSALMVLGVTGEGWKKRRRRVNAGEFIEELLKAKCKRRELNEIHDVKSDTTKFLVFKKGEENVKESSEEEKAGQVERKRTEEKKKNATKVDDNTKGVQAK